ncbi:MAG: hypothetical protein K2N23_01960 [Clostridia bacterium]|nr:hypothetical protein [Clostridia bacterium]
MKDWKKAVIWALVGFCLIIVVMGIFELSSFLQMALTRNSSIGIGKNVRNFYTYVTISALVCAVCVALIVVMAVFFAKNNERDTCKLILAFLIIALVISLFFVVFSFCTLSIFKGKEFHSFNSYEEIYYDNFIYYQTYLSAMLSTFVPLLIAGGLVLGYLIYGLKSKKSEEISDKAEEDV